MLETSSLSADVRDAFKIATAYLQVQDAIELLNRNKAAIPTRFALYFNTRNNKWTVIQIRTFTDGYYAIWPYAVADTPTMACKDALILQAAGKDSADMMESLI